MIKGFLDSRIPFIFASFFKPHTMNRLLYILSLVSSIFSMSCSDAYRIKGTSNISSIDGKTITMMTSWWQEDIGRPTIKSMEIVSHFHLGISCGCKSPPQCLCSTFTLQNSRYLATMLEIIILIPSQWYNYPKLAWSFLTPRCAVYGAWWASRIIKSCKSPMEGT